MSMSMSSGRPEREKSGQIRRIMGFMRRLRSRSKIKDQDPVQDPVHFPAVYTGPDQTWRLDDKILRRIFEYVCPHVADDSLESSEFSITEGCMLCDLRDLSNCSKVRRQWYPVASGMLYSSIRIDAVHFCGIEEDTKERHRRKSRGHDPIDPTAERLQQLCRTLRDNQYCANSVRFLKLPYMVRESNKADLARTVSVCPNLQYVDLPDGFFTGDPTCHALRQELQARCPHIRKMKYKEGSEQSLGFLLQGHWQELRVLDISKLRIETVTLRRVLGMLPRLSELSFSDLPWMNDSIFHSAPGVPEFPPLEILTVKNIPNITHQGLVDYLSDPTSQKALRALHIKDCAGIEVPMLHTILWAATHLTRLAYLATVTTSLTLDPLPPLRSRSLRILNYEITTPSSLQHSLYPPSASYHQYLTNSLMANALPALRQLYVRDPDFPESLTLAPPALPFADSPQQAPRGFNQQLEVFCKGSNELDWVYTEVAPADPFVSGRRGSVTGVRPLSSYSASKGLGPQWGGEARKSIVVGNGFSGFLAVPVTDDDGRPKSSGQFSSFSPQSDDGVKASFFTSAGREKRASRADLWR